MTEESYKDVMEEINSLRKQRRVAAVLAECGAFPSINALNYTPQFTAKQLPSLASLCETPGFEGQCFYKYTTTQTVTVREDKNREERNWNKNRYRTSTHRVNKKGKVTELASQALIEGGGYMLTVETVTAQLKNRELREQERYLVEGMARMEMMRVKREKEADSLREALHEWIEDAETIVKLHDKDLLFSVVSKIHRDDEDTVDPKIRSLSFSTIFAGRDYMITVEMPTDSDVRVKSMPRLRGLEDVIEETLATNSLLDAITRELWKLAEIV